MLTITDTIVFDHMGRTSTAMICGLICIEKGVSLGMVALSWIPVVGPVVGGFVGSMVGYMAGSTFGNAVYSGLKKVADVAKKIAKSTWDTMKSIGQGIKYGLGRLKDRLIYG